MSHLFKFQQEGSVSVYYLIFLALANRFEGLSEEVVLNCFISGLQVEIRCDVVAMTPTTLLRVVALAKLYEEKYTTPSKSSTSYSTIITTSSSYSTPYNHLPRPTTKPSVMAPKSPLPPLLPIPTSPQLKPTTIKKISPTEMQLRREKGLYYFCDEKFSFTHKCPNRQCLVLQLGEEEPENDLDPPDDTIEEA